MNRRTLVTGLLATPLGAVAVRSAAAQTPPASPRTGSIPTPAEFEGIQAAITRTWGLDVEAMMEATPGLQPEDFADGLTTMTALVLKFDTAEHARAAYDAIAQNLSSDLMAMGQGGTPTVEEEEISDLGDIASADTLKTVSGDITTWYRFVVVQEDIYTHLISALAGSEEPARQADELASYVVNEGEEEGSEAIFVAEGGSTGGLWALLPEAGHETLGNLVPIIDATIYPAP